MPENLVPKSIRISERLEKRLEAIQKKDASTTGVKPSFNDQAIFALTAYADRREGVINSP